MGASASVSLIPLRPEFDLDTIQDVVGDDAWIPAYEKQFEAAASARGSASASTSTSANNKPTVSYEQFVALYQRNLLAQTPPVGLLRNLLKKFQKILSGKGSEEADAAVRAERERREAEALSVPWDCPVCSVASQSGAECGICASDNPKLAAIRAEESNLAAEAPITERDVATVEILLEKVQSLEESVISMAGFLKSVGREDVVAGGARALSGEGGMTVKLRLLQSQQDSLHRKSLEKQLLADDIRRYDETLNILTDPANLVIVARTPVAKTFLAKKLERVARERAAAVQRADEVEAELSTATARYNRNLQLTREDVLPQLLDGIQSNARKHDELLASSFSDIVALEATTKKLQQRAVDRKWLEPFRIPDSSGSNAPAPKPGDKKARRRSWQKKKTAKPVEFPYMVRQSEAEAPSKSKVEDMEDGAAARSSLSYLLTLYRAAASTDVSVLADGLKRWSKAGGSQSVGIPCPCPVKPVERAMTKAAEKYNGDFSRLLDLARGSIVFPTVSAVRAGLEAIYDDEQVQVLRVKSRLRRDFKPVNPENGTVQTGYRDVIVNMRAAPHMGLGDHIFEVQLHVRTFFDDQPNGGARILRMARELHVIRPPLLQLDPPEISVPALEPLAAGFASTLDLQGVRFSTPKEEVVENGAGGANAPDTESKSPDGQGTRIEEDQSVGENEQHLIDILVHSICAPEVSRLTTLRLSATNITSPMIQQLCTAAATNGAGARLAHMDLACTSVATHVIVGIHQAFPGLKSLDIHECQLLGSIPDCVVEFLNMEHLRLQCNQLDGPIPTNIGLLSCLVEVPLYGNRLTGPIPTSMSQLHRLVHLHLFDNHLTGSIPENIGDLQQLESIDLHNNHLSGPIPTSVGALKSLRTLVLNKNELSGPVPSEVSQLLALEKLWLNDNKLTGKVPIQIGYLRCLATFQGRNNAFCGPIPPSIGALANLESLDLSWNKLTGTIPKTFAKCRSLATLSLDGNRLSGSIPSALGNLRQLQALHVYSNQLTGQIPTDLRRLTALTELSLFKNTRLQVPEECPLDHEGNMLYRSRAEVENFFTSL